jgi:DNA-binding transcriptional regulator YhcF (GntR family)
MSASGSPRLSRRRIASRRWCGVSLGLRPSFTPLALARSRPSPSGANQVALEFGQAPQAAGDSGRRDGLLKSPSQAAGTPGGPRVRILLPPAAAQGTRPISLARPPEFVVCPLMREIRAFRYFWPQRLRRTTSEWGLPQTLADQAHRELEEEITTLRIPPRAILSEAQLSERFGIGRTPVREALQRLAREGLVVIMPRRGLVVSEIDVAAQLRLLEVRRELERLMVRGAARRASRT